jgi:hypothetical protein
VPASGALSSTACHSPLLLFRLRTDWLINIERIRWLGLGICLHDFRHATNTPGISSSTTSTMDVSVC